MGLTVTLDSRPFDNISTHRVVFGTLTFDSAYVTGGEALTPGDLKNLGEIEKILFEPPSNSTPACRIAKYDYVNQKVLAFDMAGAEIANGVDLSGFSCGFVAFGK